MHNYDEAMEQIGNGRLQYFMLFVCGFALMCVNNEGLCMAYVVPAARCEFTITNEDQSNINSAGFIGVVISAIFWGFLSDTWGRQKTLRASLATTLVFSVLSSFSVSSLMLIITRLFTGIWYIVKHNFFCPK